MRTGPRTRKQVAPRVGAWIEIINDYQIILVGKVAPRVGAWIEISGSVLCHNGNGSLPVWERGLKSNEDPENQSFRLSLPVWERGLKY